VNSDARWPHTPGSGTRSWPPRRPTWSWLTRGRAVFDQPGYKRGRLALPALRTRIGNERFFMLLREWTARHRT
jgi:hypothetical protein